MGISIYGTFIFEGDILGLVAMAKEWRGIIRQKTEDARDRFVIEHMIEHIDIDIGRGKPMPEESFRAALDELDKREKEVKATGRRDPRIDMEFNFSCIPDGSIFYGKIFCEHYAWIKEFRERYGLKEYDYWNGTDHPDDITDAEWDERHDTWKRLLGGFNSFAEHGFTLECTALPYEAYVDLDRALAKAPSVEERAAKVAARLVELDHMQRNRPADAGPQEWHEISRAYFDARDFLKTDEGKAEIEATRLRVLPLLPVLTRENV